MCCEGLPFQLNYLIDEGVDCGKGSNTVVSLINDSLSTCPIQPVHLDLHADNCAGQNKNSTMIQVHISLTFAFLKTFLLLVPVVESHVQTQSQYNALIYGSWTYQVYPQLLFWVAKSVVL